MYQVKSVILKYKNSRNFKIIIKYYFKSKQMSSTKKRVTFKDPGDQNKDETGEGDVKVRKLTSVRYDHEYQEDDYYCK
jgi:hypothetical protein